MLLNLRKEPGDSVRLHGCTCDDCAYEAWERMTCGGILAEYHQNSHLRTIIAYNNNQPHPRNWGTFVTIFGKAAL